MADRSVRSWDVLSHIRTKETELRRIGTREKDLRVFVFILLNVPKGFGRITATDQKRKISFIPVEKGELT
jgi:hypothetical protein